MKKNRNRRPKILWAFNPFQDALSQMRDSLATLGRLARQAKLVPEPVYVVSPSEVNVVLEFSVPARERYQEVAMARARQVLGKLKAGRLSPTILIEKSLSLTAGAKALVDYAESQGAEAILVTTRAKKTFGEALMGSFAETLLHQARCPVLLVPPRYRLKSPLKRLLFVSDLSSPSHEVFKRFCRWASILGAELALFHSIPRPFSWATFAVDSLLGPDRASERQYLVLARKRREAELKPFVATAARHGIALSSTLAIGGEDAANEAIREAKKRKADLIGLAGKSGPWKARLLGSVGRRLLKRSPLPVWIQHGG